MYISEGCLSKIATLESTWILGNHTPLTTPLSSGVKLTKADSPTTPSAIAEMKDYLYQSLIGTFMYAMLGTYPNIAFAVGALSKYSSNPGKVHWNEALHVLHYLGWTKDLALVFDGSKGANLLSLILGYSDSD